MTIWHVGGIVVGLTAGGFIGLYIFDRWVQPWLAKRES